MRRSPVLALALFWSLAWAAAAQAAPSAEASAVPERGAAPLTVAFDASGSAADPGRTIVAYGWDFGDGQAGTGVAPAHDYALAGSYTATLTVTDDLGATGSTTVAVTAQGLTLSLAPASVVYGGEVVAAGAVAPAEGGISVALERLAGASWELVGTVATDASGAYSLTLAPAAGLVLRTRSLDTGALSPERTLAVVPRATVRVKRGRAFLGAPLTATVAPSSYGEVVDVTVTKYGRVVAHRTARVRSGKLKLTVPTPGLGTFRVRLAFPAADGLAAHTVATKVSATARTLRIGARGSDVRALHRRLRELRFHVPGLYSTYSGATFDAVLAFQKAFRLPRTGVVDARTWSLLGRARPLRPRFSRPSPHIEVDKTRQILMVVRGGRVTGVIPVSTGRTGNTPEGRFRILWKAPATTTWLGPAILYRTLTFHGNFAIHGYGSVPAYPASSGCVRVPLWAANWLYVQSPVGERVYVYR